MTYRRNRRGGRAAFTLIELLVVIAIIAVLVGLLAAAVMRALGKGPEAVTNAEINEMSTKLASEQRDFNVTTLPSHLRLREDNNYSSANVAIQNDYNLTKHFLQSAFGNRHITDSNIQIDWNGDGTIETTDLVLEGEQCLVFLLGGQPVQDPTTKLISMRGFPTQVLGGATGKRGPFFEFQTNRLKMFTAPDPLNGNNPSFTFPIYVDAWKIGPGTTPWTPATASTVGVPFAFFASSNTEGNGSYTADCPSLGVIPYLEPTGKFSNPSTFQIISAGRNGLFGPGGAAWNPAAGVGRIGPGSDDQSNFSKGLLGGPAN